MAVPDPPTDDLALDRLPGAAQLEQYKGQVAAGQDDAAAEAKKKYESEYRERWWAIDDQFYGSLFTYLTGVVDKARSSADTVQKASAAIATLYGAGLGVSFSVTDDPLPLRGVIPLLFLGLAIVLSTAYLAWIPDQAAGFTSHKPEAEPLPSARQRAYADEYTDFVSTAVSRRASVLRASVVALALGLTFLPAPFVDISTEPAVADDLDEEIELTEWPSARSVRRFDPEPAAALMAEMAKEVAGVRAEERAKATSSSQPSVRVEGLPEQSWLLLTVISLGLVVTTLLVRKRTS